jgi:hypothetical protein
MLPTLENSEKFKTEFNNFKEKISQITNESVKKDLNDKLVELLKNVRDVDNQHQDMFVRHQLPIGTIDSRDKILEIRKYITKRLTDWDRSVKSTQSS